MLILNSLVIQVLWAAFGMQECLNRPNNDLNEGQSSWDGQDQSRRGSVVLPVGKDCWKRQKRSQITHKLECLP